MKKDNLSMNCAVRHLLTRIGLILICLITSHELMTTNLLVNNPNVQPAPPISIFGDTITNFRLSQISIFFSYSVPTDKVAFFTSGTTLATATVAAAAVNSMATIASGTNVAGFCNITTYNALQYIPGHDGIFLFTAMFNSVSTNSTAWIGPMCVPFNSRPAANTPATDAYAVGYNGTQFSILYSNSSSGSTVQTIIPATTFNIDLLNGTGPSGIVFNGSTLNVFKVQFGWLGTAPIIFSILRQDGTWWKFHIILRPNNFTVPSIAIPMLQLRAEVLNAGTTTGAKISTASWDASTVGQKTENIVRTYEFFRNLPSAALTTSEAPIFTIKNNSTFNFKANYMNVGLIFASGCSSGTTSIATYRLIKNATLTGATYAVTPYSPSCVSIDNAATVTTSGTPVASFISSNNIPFNLPLANVFDVVLAPNETLTFTGFLDVTDNTNTASAAIVWQEPVA